MLFFYHSFLQYPLAKPLQVSGRSFGAKSELLTDQQAENLEAYICAFTNEAGLMTQSHPTSGTWSQMFHQNFHTYADQDQTSKNFNSRSPVLAKVAPKQHADNGQDTSDKTYYQ